jgi:hypothetical protein
VLLIISNIPSPTEQEETNGVEYDPGFGAGEVVDVPCAVYIPRRRKQGTAIAQRKPFVRISMP